MNELKIFNNPDFGDIRTMMIEGEPWFVGKDVCRALGYADTYSGVRKNVDAEDKRGCRWDTPINLQELWKQYRRVVKENGAIALFSAQPFTTELIGSYLYGADQHGQRIVGNVLFVTDVYEGDGISFTGIEPETFEKLHEQLKNMAVAMKATVQSMKGAKA